MDDSPSPQTCAERDAQLAAIAERTGKPLATVQWISYALNFAGLYQRKGVPKRDVNATELCRMLIADIGERRPAALRDRLVSIGIHSSVDVGRIVYAMVDARLCNASGDDKESDFAAIFHADDVERYFRDSGVFATRDWPTTIKSMLVWTFYIGGLVLVVAGRQLHRNPEAAYIGSALIGVGWLVSKLRVPRRTRFGWPWSTLERRHLDRASV
jgi:hypothetical protein